MKITDFKPAFVSSNREVKSDGSNIKAKIKSISEDGILMPVYWTTVGRAIGEGLEVVDLEGNKVTGEDYKVIIDGQHRVKAAAYILSKDGIEVDIPLTEYQGDMPISRWLAIVNTEAVAWKGTDFVSGAAAVSKDEVVKFAKELANKGFKLTQISWALTFNEKKLTNAVFKSIMDGATVDWSKYGVNVDTAKAYLKAMERMDKKINCSKIFKVIANISNERDKSKSDVIKALAALTDAEAKTINKAKSKEVEELITRYLKNHL